MNDDPSMQERFVQLETKIAYQEKLLADLNDVVLSHTRAVDRLEARVQQLQDLLREQGNEPLGHERPPHY